MAYELIINSPHKKEISSKFIYRFIRANTKEIFNPLKFRSECKKILFDEQRKLYANQPPKRNTIASLKSIRWFEKRKKKNRLTKYTTNARFKNYRLETVAPFVANVCTPIDSIQITFCLPAVTGKQRGHTWHRRSPGVHRWKKELRRCSQVSCSWKNRPDKVLHDRTIRFFFRLERRPFCNNNSSLERLLFLFSLPFFFFFLPNIVFHERHWLKDR